MNDDREAAVTPLMTAPRSHAATRSGSYASALCNKCSERERERERARTERERAERERERARTEREQAERE
jgi:hypothetical protein